MNSAGLSSICQGTNGLNGSALRAILRRCGAALALAPGVGDCVLVPLCVHAPRSSAATTAHMTGHRVLPANMNLSLQRKADADDRVEFASASPLRSCSRRLAPAPALSAFVGSLASIPRTSNSCSALSPGLTWGPEEVRL